MVTILSNGADLAAKAGQAKVNYGLAFTDCYVLAASEVCKREALFRKREKEMIRKMAALEDKDRVTFLEDYASTGR